MKELFNYCVYRIAYTYKKMKMHDYIGQGYFLMFFAFTGYLLALTQFVLFQFGAGLNKLLIVLFCIPLFIEVLFFTKLFPNSEKVYNECDSKYRNEKFRWLKGFLVFLFLVMSLVSYILVLIVFKPQHELSCFLTYVENGFH